MERKPISKPEPRGSEVSLHTGSHYLRRAIAIAGVFTRFGFAHVLQSAGLSRFLARPRQGKIDAATQGLALPVRLRLALEEIGATGIKVGQVLSTRGDLLPPDFITELRKLQDEVPPFPGEEAQALLEEELGGPIAQFFAEFDPQPVAAASLSQVHRARRCAGTEVAVKIQRPEVRQQIETDLVILSFAAREAQRYSDWCRENDVVGWAEELAHLLRAELDFTREAGNLERLHKQLQEHTGVTAPRVHWDLTTGRVLTMDFIEGVSPNDEAGLAAVQQDRTEIARRFALSMFRQVTEEGFFHGDPHAGNLKVLRDGRLAFLDCGHIDFAGRELREQMVAMLQALLEGDSRGVVNVLTAVGVISPRTDLPSLRLDVDKLVARYTPDVSSPLSLAEAMDVLLGLLVKHSIRVPATFASLVRALIITEGVCLQLDPHFKAREVSREAVNELVHERLRPRHLFSDLSSLAREWHHHLCTLPRQISDLLLQAQAGGTKLRVEIDQLNKPLHRLDVMVNRLAFAIVVAAMVLAAAVMISSEQAVVMLGTPLALAFGGIGVFMGLWLFYSILRSGRL